MCAENSVESNEMPPGYLGTAPEYYYIKTDKDFLKLPDCQMEHIELWLLCHPHLEAQNALYRKLLQDFRSKSEVSGNFVVPFETMMTWIAAASRCHIDNLLPPGEQSMTMENLTSRLVKPAKIDENGTNIIRARNQVEIEPIRLKVRQLLTILSYSAMQDFSPDESTMITFALLRILMNFDSPMEEFAIRRFLHILNSKQHLESEIHPIYATFSLLSENIFVNLKSAAIFASCVSVNTKVALRMCIEICVHCLQKPEFITKIPSSDEKELSVEKYTKIICDNIAAILYSAFEEDVLDKKYFTAFRDCLGIECAENILREHNKLQQLTV